ncbi:hypothetical protein PF010_g17007 [Phytophthora fragariae]|uniref:Leishmanolysin-like peptidase n=1 Tax=Phytophthora fragariae TaxID=53985 RepID=A0A6G0NJ57_9STRA|nr:hypothetical protein PF010_g17007 [Phytophthora fragariae]KAE9210574.1 hypothetical protein PF004_g16152 [Phytophthora fragariae]
MTKTIQVCSRRRRIIALFLACCLVQVVGGCIHDSLDHKFVTGAQIYDDSHPFQVAESKRRLRDEANERDSAHVTRQLEDAIYQPIRMTPYYDNSSLNHLSDATRARVFQVVTEAIQRISRALQVVPVSGNLFAERFCTSRYSTTPPVCHSIAQNELCLEMPIPDEHFASMTYCDKCTSNGCTHDACTLSPAGTGVPDSDFVIYVRAESTTNCKSGSTLAYASTCQQDQYDRPTFGMVNFCPLQISTANSSFERQVSTALHEFSHALGFSARFFPLMRDEAGNPRTPRDEQGNPPTFSAGTCPNGKEIDYYVEPANTTIKYSTERGHVVAKMVTPRVRAFVQDHFNCSKLEGAEVESQDGGCLGSHWEERLFEPEYMTPVDSFRNVFSALTLAFFADSGWYRVNASTSEVMHFGRKKGCSFATKKCVNPSTELPIAADHFCTSSAFQGCSVDATSRSVCSLSTKDQNISAEYQYFPSNPRKGGVNIFADFCPLNVGYAKGDCTMSPNLLKLGDTSINAFGETYCPTCRCTSTSLRSVDSTSWTISPTRQSGCYAMRCLGDSSTAVIELTIPRSSSNDTVIVSCTKKGEILTVPGFTGTITCPDPLVVCAVDDPSRILLTEELVSSDSSTDVGSVSVGSDDYPDDSGNASKASSTGGSDASLADSGSTSYSSSNSSTDPGNGSIATISTGTTANGADGERLASLWIALVGTWLVLDIVLYM